MNIDNNNLTTAGAYGASIVGTLYGFVQKIDWLTALSVMLSAIVAITNLYYQRKKANAEITMIEHEIQNKDEASKASLEYLKERRRLELLALERKLK